MAGRLPGAEERGRLVARLLATAWRASPAPPDLDDQELAVAVPLLLRTGGGPLGWWRLRGTPLADTPAAVPLREAYRFHALQGAVFEERLPRVLGLLRGAGARPVVAKGWAAARLYPEPGLRPYGDIDVYVPTADHAAARDALDRAPGLAVDLHRGFPELDDRDPQELLARARTVALGTAEVPVPAPEDHLRLLCRHLLRHGAARPLWLCDIALVLESCPPGFDWDLVLAGTRRRRDAVLAVLALTGAVLRAELAGSPAANRAERLPPWLVPTVLRQWGEGFVRREPLLASLRRPGLWQELRRHWPNGIEASAAVDAPFDRLPRLPLQALNALVRAARLAGSLPRLRRSGRSLASGPRSTT